MNTDYNDMYATDDRLELRATKKTSNVQANCGHVAMVVFVFASSWPRRHDGNAIDPAGSMMMLQFLSISRILNARRTGMHALSITPFISFLFFIKFCIVSFIHLVPS